MKQEAINTAVRAGDFLIQNFRKDEALLKERGLSKEIVTRYDQDSDKLILEELQNYFPDHNFLTEETGFIDNKSECLWIIDSMDGSGNFAAGNPFFSVSIALAKNNEVILGVVYAPFLNELYTAEKGKGAYLNSNPIKVSEVEVLSKAYIVTCEGGSTNQRLAEFYKQLYPQVKDMRKLGSAAIEGGFVATGRADSYLTLQIDPWDVAATVLIVQEAGGKATDLKGNPWTIEKSDLLLTNNKLHSSILEKINNL